MLQTVTKDNQLYAIVDGVEVRAYTKKVAMETIGLPANQNPRMRNLVMSNKIKHLGFKAQKPGSKVPEALYNADDVDAYRDSYKPRGEGTGDVYEIRTDEDTIKHVITVLADTDPKCHEFIEALLQRVNKTEERRAYNEIRKAQKQTATA